MSKSSLGSLASLEVGSVLGGDIRQLSGKGIQCVGGVWISTRGEVVSMGTDR